MMLKLSPEDRVRLSHEAKKLMQSEVLSFIFNDLDQTLLEQLKTYSADQDQLLDTLRSINVLKTRLEFWANQYEANKQLIQTHDDRSQQP